MPQNSNFRLPNGHRFFANSGSCGYGAKSWWRPPRVNIGANGAPLGPKIGQNHKKILCPKIQIFHYPTVIDFSQKIEITVVAPNHGGDPLGSILGPMGSHWVQKMGQNCRKLPCPKIRIFDYPAVIHFSKKIGSCDYIAKSQWWPPRVHLGWNGVPLDQNRGQNRENLPCPKIRIIESPVVIDFSKQNGSYGYGAKSRWRTSRVYLGADGVPLGKKKWVKTVKN